MLIIFKIILELFQPKLLYNKKIIYHIILINIRNTKHFYEIQYDMCIICIINKII